MGFLLESEPLSWEESLPYLQFIREHGIEQFLNGYHLVKKRENDNLRWGDEIEYGVFKLSGSGNSRRIEPSLRSSSIIDDLIRLEDHGVAHGLSEADRANWVPEYGAWMLESTPGKPFEGLTAILRVEDSMRLRRSRLLAVLYQNEIAPTMTAFPMLGVLDDNPTSALANTTEDSITGSSHFPDTLIFPHARFRTLTANIRARRGKKVEISRSLADGTPVTADAMGFGMGCCCLQVTFQAKNVEESRHLYDQVAVLTPLMLALSAACPFLRGWLVDSDARWETISESVDDRTKAELVHECDQFRAKSRYSSFNCFLGDGSVSGNKRAAKFNDSLIVCDPVIKSRLLSGGIDELLAQHVASLFVRDPLVIFKDRIDIDDRENADHWESLQSTNWQNVRWKPPPPVKGALASSDESHIGWRVEFRSMELQVTDFENAAFVVFVVLISRVILGLELDLYVPISKIEENMKRAGKRDAVLNQLFWFKTNLFPAEIAESVATTPREGVSPDDDIKPMNLSQILSGDDLTGFPGLIPLCRTYLDFIGCDGVTRSKIETYLEFISAKANGDIPTTAQWMRQFIEKHPDYKGDSRIPQSVGFDLCKLCADIGEGKVSSTELLGRFSSKVARLCPAKNPFLHMKAEREADMTVDSETESPEQMMSCAKTACEGCPGPSQPELLRQYLKRAVMRKVKSQQERLEYKQSQKQKIEEDISRMNVKLASLWNTLA